jgi:hypothetical protein
MDYRSGSTDLKRVRWPIQWRPLIDDAEALSFGRFINTNIASTVLGELRREICDRHPLAAVECRPVAWNSPGGKDFLFVTNQPRLTVVAVHFTWCVESDPAWPWIKRYADLQDFIRRERHWGLEIRSLLQKWRLSLTAS